jgi:acyl-CoA synthetase (AMP-forming)/AMP-acid ligase II
VFDESQLRSYCTQRLQQIFIPVCFIAVEKIPRNDMAKIERSRLPELARANAAPEDR